MLLRQPFVAEHGDLAIAQKLKGLLRRKQRFVEILQRLVAGKAALLL